MRVNTLPAIPISLLALLTGVCPRPTQEIFVKAGELVALHCPRRYRHGDGKLTWTSYTSQKIDLTDMSPDEQRQEGVLLHERSLVILRASNHQGNYSCSFGNGRNSSSKVWFKLTLSSPNDEESEYLSKCYTQETCRLNCPEINIPAINTPNITSSGISWQKEGDSLLEVDNYFSSVEKKDSGVYTCIRSYLFRGQTYSRSFTVELDVQPKKKSGRAKIISPHDKDVFHADLHSKMVIDCKAVLYSGLDEVFWISGSSVVGKNSSLPVFYSYTRVKDSEKIETTASLIFKSLSEKDLSKSYTCKLESVSKHSSFVTIVLAKNAHTAHPPSSRFLLFSIVGVVAVIVVIVAICLKLKVDITLLLRDTLGCNCGTSDGKRYDAFLMSYKSDADAGLGEDDRKWLEKVLEDWFGYSLCLNNRDIPPGKAVAEAVLDCIEKSRMLVLVPASMDPDLGSSLLGDIHATLEERQNSLVFIKTQTTDVATPGAFPEALQSLGEAGRSVIWEGSCSMPPSSSFWKQLRYRLPAPQHAPKTRRLPQTATRDDIC